MTTTPLVTVAMPSYNHGKYIEESIRGLIAQDYRAIELIVIDDGSSDDTAARLERLAPACRERFVRFEWRARENRGLCNTLNEALAWAEGSYLAINDSDDVLLPAAITTLVGEMESDATLNGVFGGAYVVDEAGNRTSVREPKPRRYGFAEILARDKDMISSSGLLRTAAMRAAGGYLDGLFIEDWYIMLKLTEGGAVLKLIPTPLAQYRLHDTNISKNLDRMFRARLQILDLFAHHDGHPERLALVHVENAIEYWRTSKRISLGHLVAALRLHPAIVAQPLFRAAMGRLLAPALLIDRIKARRDRR